MVVAQLVEPQIVILVVAGSSPVDHPIFFWLKQPSLSFCLFKREVTKLTPTPFLNAATILRYFRFENHSSANCYDTDYLRVSLTCTR